MHNSLNHDSTGCYINRCSFQEMLNKAFQYKSPYSVCKKFRLIKRKGYFLIIAWVSEIL